MRSRTVTVPWAEIRVWDPFVRFFHWTLVASFFVAYLSGDDLETLHVIAGYCVGLLILARVVWGMVGPRYARFTEFVYAPRTVLHEVRELLKFRAKRYIGHSPAGGAMVVTLLSLLLAIVSSGLITLALREGEGPLAGWITQNRSLGHTVGGLHEFLANAGFALVLLHISGVLFSSLVHRENLIKAMWTGRKQPRIKE